MDPDIGTIEVNNGAQFSVGGAVKNVNTINVNSGKLAVDDFDLTVNGGGLIGLGGSGATLVVSAGRTLVNVDNTIAPEIFREGGLHQCPFRVSKRTMVWLGPRRVGPISDIADLYSAHQQCL